MILHLVLAIGFAGGFGIEALGTSFMIPPFDVWIADTPNIVRGQLSHVRSERALNANGQTNLYTFASLEVAESLKGSIPLGTQQVRKMGGSLDGETLEVPGSPEFPVLTPVVLFLGKVQSDGSYEVNGLELGEFMLNEQEQLKGGLFNHRPARPEANRSWNLTQLRSEIARQTQTLSPKRRDLPSTSPAPHLEGGALSSSPTPPNTSPSIEAANADITPRTPIETNHPDQPNTPWLGMTVALAIAIGIFFFFKGRS